jgi:N-acyl-D-aspartate/D-glutamate deacylase
VLANVRLRDGKIADIGPFKPSSGETVIDAKGLLIAPGFIDFQSLSPSDLEKPEAMSALVTRGVTTAVLGSDGTGPYSVEEFMLPFDEKPTILNIAMLVGHGRVRRQILGDNYNRAPNADELQRMTELISDAMKQGAFGLGTDLQQEPASFSSPEELLALARTVAKFGGSIVLRLRNEREKLADAVKEAVSMARDAKVPVQVITSSKPAIAEIDKARAQRIDISADSYALSQLATDKTTTLERAVQRMTSAPAGRMGLRERGVIKKAVPADLVVFSPAPSLAVKYVFVNGTMVVKNGQPADARPGQALR